MTRSFVTRDYDITKTNLIIRKTSINIYDFN